MKRVLAFVISTSVGLLVMSGAKAAPNDFYCELNNGKVLRVVDMGGSPKYMYGTAADNEISLPTGENGVRYGQVSFSKGGAGYFRFINGKYSYVVYDGLGEGWSFTGLLVYKGDTLVMKKECKENPPPALSGFNNTKAMKDNDTNVNIFGYLPE